MPLRVVNVTEKDISPQPANVVTVAAGKSTDVLPDLAGKALTEVCGRYIFNDSGTVAYYAFGQDCDSAKNYHGKLQDQQQLDVSNFGGRVSVYSAAGGNFATTVLVRKDLDSSNGQIFQAAQGL